MEYHPLADTNEKQIVKEVIANFLNGDTAHFVTIKKRISRYVHKQYFGDALNREDIVSDIINILVRNLQNGAFYGDSLKAFEVYIFGIVKNTVLNRAKKSGRLVFPTFVPDIKEDSAKYVDKVVARKDLSRKILNAMDERCQELLKLKFMNEWSDQEIADKYNKSKNAISTAISRCIKKAKDLDFV